MQQQREDRDGGADRGYEQAQPVAAGKAGPGECAAFAQRQADTLLAIAPAGACGGLRKYARAIGM